MATHHDIPLDALIARLPEAVWTRDANVIAPLLTDWRDRYHGQTPLLARPRSPRETADILLACRQTGFAATPQGGNTGLVGGSTPNGEILVSTARLNAIRSVDPVGATLIAEAGVTLSEVHQAAEDVDLMFPLSLGSQSAATIGGLISTNAGGVAVLRYGMMRDLVLGLEVALPDGRVWNGLRTLRKDNTGYDLKQLFIGGEGTLGLVTAAALKLFPRPQRRLTGWCAVGEPADAVALLATLRAHFGDAVTAFELMPQNALGLVLTHIPDTRPPLGNTAAPWSVLLELSFFAAAEASVEMAETILNQAINKGLVIDATIAKSDAESKQLWRLRETMPEAEKRNGPAIKHDVSTPVAAMPAFIARASAAAKTVLPGAEIIAFGHVGDGNVHFNVAAPAGMDREALFAEARAVTAVVHDAAVALGGSISAEHGIGVLKREELAERRAGPELDMMRAIKAALDPGAVMNPRVLFTPAGLDADGRPPKS